MLIHDLSNWVDDEEEFVYPDSYFLGLTYPNGEVENLEITPKNGFILYDDSLADGVYEFVLDNCGVTYTQKELITPKIQCSLDLALVESSGSKDLDAIRDIQSDLLVAKASAGIGNYQSAEKILELIQIKLKNLSCDCNCK